MPNQVEPRRRPSHARRRRRVEMTALAAEARCGTKRGRSRRGLAALFRLAVTVALLVVPILAAVNAYAVTTLDPPPESTYWASNAPQARGDLQRSAFADLLLLAKEPSAQWQVGGYDPFLAGAVVDQENAYVVDRDGTVMALNLTTGDTVWTTELAAEVSATPAAAYGWLYVATEKKTLHALSLRNGDEIRKVTLAGVARAPPLVAEGRVFQGNEAGTLQVFEALTLDELWRFDTATTGFDANGTTPTLDTDLRHPIRATPALYDGRIYISAWNGRLYSLSVTGNVYGNPDSWYWTYEGTDIISAAPVVDRHHGRVIIATGDGRLRALATGDGTFVWEIDAGQSFVAGPALNKTFLVVATADGRIIGVEPGAGTVLWQRFDHAGILSGAVLARDAIVALSADGRLSLLSTANGTTLLRGLDGAKAEWRLPGPSHVAPAVAHRGVVTTDHSGNVTLIGPTPALFADLVASSATLNGVRELGVPLTFNVTLRNDGPDFAPDVVGRLLVDGEETATKRFGRMESGAAAPWSLPLVGLGEGGHTLRVVFAPERASDPNPADGETSIEVVIAAPSFDVPANANNEGTTAHDASAGATGFGSALASAFSPWMVPAGLFAVSGGILVARYLRRPAVPGFA